MPWVPTVYHAGSLVGGAAPGFPRDWVVYDVNKLFAYLATPAAYNQLPNPDAFKAQLDANGGGFTAHPDPNTYSMIKERISSAYGMATLEGDGDMPWTLNAGIRYTEDQYDLLRVLGADRRHRREPERPDQCDPHLRRPEPHLAERQIPRVVAVGELQAQPARRPRVPRGRVQDPDPATT